MKNIFGGTDIGLPGRTLSRRTPVSTLLRRAGYRAEEVSGRDRPELQTLEQRQLLAIVVNAGQNIPDQTFNQNGSAIVISLNGRFDDNGITGTLVRFNTTSGVIDLELFDQAGDGRTRTMPIAVANFLAYTNAGTYNNTIIHRSVPGFVVQGGGYALPTANNTSPVAITALPAIQNEAGNTNAFRTISFAKVGNDPNSATSQWFFNLADNSSLDGQPAAFSAFGRIINGASVPSAIEALRRFNFGGAFNELPVRASYDGVTIRPADFVNVSSIATNADRSGVVNSSLTYTITSANPALATARIYNGQLVVTPGQGQTGTTTVTVRATGVSGTFVEDVFNVTVGATQATEQLSVAPVPIAGVGGPYTLTAGGSTFSDPNVTSVSFYLDSNRDGIFDAATDTLLGQDASSAGGFTLTGTAAGFQSGSNLIFARGALAAGGNTAVATQLAFVNAAPTVAGVTASPSPVLTVGANVTITANNVADADSSVAQVAFYRDTNGNGVLDIGTDAILGTDTSATGGYTITVATTGFSVGSQLNTIFAVATDVEGTNSVPVSTTLRINTPPTITVFGPTFNAVRSVPAVITATVTDDGTITQVQFFRDTNGNGTFDTGTDVLIGTGTAGANGLYSVTLSTTGLALGNIAIFCRATDADGATTAISTATLVLTSAPPRITALARTPDPLPQVGANLTLTATGVSDPDGTVAAVRFYLDNGDNVFDPAVDTLLGTDPLAAGGYAITIAATSDFGFTVGTYRIYAQATDNDGVVTPINLSPTVTGRINTPPTIASLTANPTSVARRTNVALTANTVADSDGTITRVDFYRDANGNGTLEVGTDTLLGSDLSATGGYTLSASTNTFAVGDNTVFARATDNNGGVSTAASTTVTITNAPPLVTGVTSTPAPVVQIGNNVTLTASGVSDPDGTVAQVKFFLDTNGTPGLQADDTLLGSDPNAAGGYTLTIATLVANGWAEGNNTVFAQAVDNDGDTGNSPARVVVINARPVVSTVTVTPGTVNRSNSITIVASGVTDAGGSISRVDFFVDLNGNGTLEASDRLLGAGTLTAGNYRLVTTATGFPVGTVTLFARAVDNLGAQSVPGTTTLTVNNAPPVITSVAGTPSPVVQLGNNVTLTATGASDPDGTVAQVRFYLEDGTSPGFQAGEDTLLGSDSSAVGGYTLVVPTSAANGWAEGANSVYAQVVDNDGALAATGAGTVTINPRPVVGSLVVSPPSVPRATQITLTASNVTDNGTITRVEFFLDSNNNGTLEASDRLLGTGTLLSGSYRLVTTSTGFPAGTATLFARAVDNLGALGAAASTTLTVTNAAPLITSVTGTPSPVVLIGNNVTLTANGARDNDGTVAQVRFYLENGTTAGFQEAEDTLLGTDTSSVGGYTIVVATASANGWAEGANTVYAQVVDNDGASAATPAGTVTINPRPTIASVTASPNPIARGSNTVVTANTVADNGSVTRVDFFRDINGNGVLDFGTDTLLGSDTNAAGGYTLSVNVTNAFNAGANTIFARAVDNLGALSVPTSGTLNVTNALPTLTTVTSTPRPVVQLGNNVTLSTTGARDPDGTVASIRYYLETNGTAGFQSDDFQLGTQTAAAGGYALTVATAGANGWADGNNAVYAVAVDNDGGLSTAVTATVVVNARPTVGSLTASATSGILRLSNITLTANNVASSTSTIRKVDFYRDVNANGQVDVGIDTLLGTDLSATGGYTAIINTAGFATGNNTLLARATDVLGAVSAPVSLVVSVDNRAPSITGATVTPSPLGFIGQNITIRTAGVADQDGLIANVLFFAESNGVAGFQPASANGVPGDTLIGTAFTGTGGVYTITVQTSRLGNNFHWTNNGGVIDNVNTVYSCAVDNEAANNFVATNFTITNNANLPEIGTFTAPENVLARGTRVAMSVSGILINDAGTTIRSADFYRDTNNNSKIDVGVDEFLGTKVGGVAGEFGITNVSTANFIAGGNVILTRVQDSRGVFSEVFTGTVNISNVPPVIGAIAATPNPVVQLGNNITLRATGVSDPDVRITNVKFYLDDGDGVFNAGTDRLLGTVTTGAAGTYSLTIATTTGNGFSEGNLRYYARAQDNESAFSNVVTTQARINATPTVESLSSNPGTLSRTSNFTITASNVTDPDNNATNAIASVRFYFDSNNDGVLTAADTLIGLGVIQAGTHNWVITRSGALLPNGSSVRIFAQATDSLGGVGPAFGFVFNIA